MFKRDNGLSREEEHDLSYLIHEATTMKDLIQRVEKMMGAGAEVEDIHHMLTEEEGLSQYDAWLTYKGAKLVYDFTSNYTFTLGELEWYMEQKTKH